MGPVGFDAGLQCGHGHEAVENSTAGNVYTARPKLQCGHGHEAVENGGPAAAPVRGSPASMRPRP